MSNLLNLAKFENKENPKEKNDQTEPIDFNKIKSLEKYLEQQFFKSNINEKNDYPLIKKKKKLTNISDPSLLEADILNESYSEISNNQIIRETIDNLNHLFIEEDNIISKIIEFSYDANNLCRTRDLFDALYYEFKIRFQNKKIALGQLKDKEEQNFEYIKNLENNLKKTQNELMSLKKFQETKQFRHVGKLKIKSNEDMRDLDIYDWIIDVDFISTVLNDGWKIYFNSLFYESLEFDEENIFVSINKNRFLNEIPENSNVKTLANKSNERIVSFIGLYDKGKTFVLNNLSNTNLPSEKKVQSRGLSFKEFQIEADTKLILLDMIGSYSPVNVFNENSVMEKERTEQFLLDSVFEISDYFICVINDFTAIDQRYLDKLSKKLKNYKNKPFHEIIVFHNLKQVESQEILDHLWETQVAKIYGEGLFQRTKVSAINPINGKFQEKHVHWFQTNYSRHVRLANDDSMLGNSLNPWTFSLVKLWLTTQFFPIENKPPFTIKRAMDIFSFQLSFNLKKKIKLEIEKTNEKLVKNVKVNNKSNEFSEEKPFLKNNYANKFKMQKIPKIKSVIINEEYVVYANVPGYSIEDFIISCLDAKTFINMKQMIDESQNKNNELTDFKQIRESFITIDPPENFEKKWSEFYVEKGVLFLKFKKISKKEEEYRDLI